MRTERATLQHEVDIMGQRLTQESLTLKDDLRGMFNDRKMAIRMEQRAMESSIQELNYKITVALNSDSKGEVEGLRWVLTRRAAMAIVSMASEFHVEFPVGCTKSSTSPHTGLASLFLLHDTYARAGAQKDECSVFGIIRQWQCELYRPSERLGYTDEGVECDACNYGH